MIYNIIEKIAQTSSSNEKIEILKANKDNELLKKVLYYCYNPLFNYYTKHQVEEYRQYETVEEGSEVILDYIFPVLDALIARKFTGNAAIDYLNDLANELHYLDRIILNKIIARDMACGISAKSINKVWKDLIRELPYMRCSLLDKVDRINFPAFVQKKADGLFCNVVIVDGDVNFFTRNGTEFDLNCLKDEIHHSFTANTLENSVVLHGELLVSGSDGNEESRKKGNGLINSLIKKEQSTETLLAKIAEKIGSSKDKLVSELTRKLAEYDETDKKLKLVVWDIVPYDDWVKGESKLKYYDERFPALQLYVSEHVSIVDGKIVNSFEEAQEFYKEQIENGYEGAVLKNLSMGWKSHTSPEQLKMKSEKETDLEIVGYVPGTGENVGGIGSLCCVSSCRNLKVDVSGLTKVMRGIERVDENDSSKGWKVIEGFDCNCYNGKIITVKFNEAIQSESKDTYSLFLPRFVEIRHDKNEADDLETIKKL